MELPGRAHAKSWEGAEVLDLTGTPVGTCIGVYADADTEVVEWLLVDVTGHRRSFVPAVDVVEQDGVVRLSFVRDRVVTAPSVGDAAQLSKRDEMTLYRHYGVPFTDDASESLLPEYVDIPDDVDGGSDSAESTPERPALGAPPAASTGTPVLPPVLPPVLAPMPSATPVPDGAGLPSAPAALVPPNTVPAPPVQTGTPSPVPAAPPVPVQPLSAPEAAVEVDVEVVEEPVLPAPEVEPERASEGARRGSSSSLRTEVLSTGAPLAAVAAAVAAAWLVLWRLERRAARRRALPARTRRTSRQAVHEGRAAAGQVAAALAAASSSVEQRGHRAAKAAGKRRKQSAKAARKGRKQVSKTAARKQQRLVTAAAAATSRASRAGQKVADAPGSVAGAVADGAGRVRRSVASALWDVMTAAAAAGGYLLGARAGRERYAEIADLAAATATRPEVQTVKQALLDSGHRGEAVASLKEQGRQFLTRVLPG